MFLQSLDTQEMAERKALDRPTLTDSRTRRRNEKQAPEQRAAVFWKRFLRDSTEVKTANDKTTGTKKLEPNWFEPTWLKQIPCSSLECPLSIKTTSLTNGHCCNRVEIRPTSLQTFDGYERTYWSPADFDGHLRKNKFVQRTSLGHWS